MLSPILTPMAASLLMSRSRLGPNLASAFGWAAATGIAINPGAGTATFDGSQADNAVLLSTGALVIGKSYQLQYTVSLSAGEYRFRQGGESLAFTSVPGTFSRILLAANVNPVQIQSGASALKFVGALMAVSVREILV